MNPNVPIKEPFKCATYHPSNINHGLARTNQMNTLTYIPANCSLIPYRLKSSVKDVSLASPNASMSSQQVNNKPLAMVSPLPPAPQFDSKAVQTDAWSIDLSNLCPLEDYARSLRVEGILDSIDSKETNSSDDFNGMRKKYEELDRALKIQTAVNRDIKKLLVASVGTDFAEKIETLTRANGEAHVMINNLTNQYHEVCDKLDRVTIESDLWRSKFVAGRMMLDEIAGWKACVSTRYIQSISSLQALLLERNRLCEELSDMHNYLLCIAEAILPPHNYPQTDQSFQGGLTEWNENSPTTPSWLAICRENRRLARSLCLNIPGTKLMARLASRNRPIDNLATPTHSLMTSSSSSTSSSIASDMHLDSNLEAALSNSAFTRSLLKTLNQSEHLSAAERAAVEVLRNHLTIEVDPTGRYRCAYNSPESQTFERLTTACCKGCKGETFIL